MNAPFSFVNERDAPSVAEQPSVKVSSWRVVKAMTGDLHLLIILDHGPLRITSSIANFNPATAEMITQSGRRYEVIGPPEERQHQLSLLAASAVPAGLGDAQDVSHALWQAITKQ
jgi:hypothetical protein